MAAVLDRNSKADTRFLCEGGSHAAAAIDISQWRIYLTDATTYCYSVLSRLAVRSPREISIVVDLSTASSGILINWGKTDGTVYIYRITVAAGVLTFGNNNAALSPTVSPPNINGVRLFLGNEKCNDSERFRARILEKRVPSGYAWVA